MQILTPLREAELIEAIDSHKTYIRTGGARGEELDLRGTAIPTENQLRTFAERFTNYQGARFRFCSAIGLRAPGCDFNLADLSKGCFHHSDFKNSRFVRARLHGTGLEGADLSGADLRWADLSCALLHRATLDGARISFTVGNGREIKNLNLDAEMPVVYTHDTMAIGHSVASIEKWEWISKDFWPGIRDLENRPAVGDASRWMCENLGFILDTIKRFPAENPDA